MITTSLQDISICLDSLQGIPASLPLLVAPPKIFTSPPLGPRILAPQDYGEDKTAFWGFLNQYVIDVHHPIAPERCTLYLS
ncbi:hypothetical protein FKM82_010366 [Ascaphus truei]